MKNLDKYLIGNGIDVSENSKNYVEPNNLYSLRSYFKPETLDFIYSKELINKTKFYRILLKEWFYACKKNKYIIIEMSNNELLDFKKLKNECLLVLKNKIKLIYLEENKKENRSILVLKKIKDALVPQDNIKSWTFGIITDGKREEWVDKEIDSIIALNIPHFEIIVCGVYNEKCKKNVKYLKFNSEIPWICKKKNFICQNSKYENIVLTHDKYLFDKNWYIGMKKYGNYFEVLSCIIKDVNGNRAGDWISYGTDWGNIPKIGFLNYNDWDKTGYISGGLYILKKSIWKKVKWDNKLLWRQAEDVKLSKDFFYKGILSRFNPYSKCTTLFIKPLDLKSGLFKFNNKKLGKCENRPLIFYISYLKRLII